MIPREPAQHIVSAQWCARNRRIWYLIGDVQYSQEKSAWRNTPLGYLYISGRDTGAILELMTFDIDNVAVPEPAHAQGVDS